MLVKKGEATGVATRRTPSDCVQSEAIASKEKGRRLKPTPAGAARELAPWQMPQREISGSDCPQQ